MQYFGKGGTNPFNVFSDKQKENQKKQRKLMRKGASADPDVMGMMYWTTTGLLESIQKRNDKMWKAKNVSALQKLWTQGLSEAIEARLPANVDPTSHASGQTLKVFMPNIVMIDFADPAKCKVIYELNTVAASELANAAKASTS
jgi:hypothetical protein